MTSEQQTELLDYLKSLGFPADNFAGELHSKQQRNTPHFNIACELEFGREQMNYELHFRKIPQNDSYILESYAAIHRAEIIINHDLIDGVDTASLEQRMQEIDWTKYFGSATEIKKEDASKVQGIMVDLLKLQDAKNAKGAVIQDELQYKYWPATTLNETIIPLKRTYEHTQTFSNTDTGICPANLAFHILSGRLEDLYEKVMGTGATDFFRADLHRQVSDNLSKNAASFQVVAFQNSPSGFVDFVLPVTMVDGQYSIDNYSLSLTEHPSIEHGEYGGIDTKELEKMMAQINWQDLRQLIIFHENSEPEFTSQVGDVRELMFSLENEADGRNVVDALQLKYWSDAPFFEDDVAQSAWDKLTTLPKSTMNFPAELKVNSAVNLLAGRPIMEYKMFPYLQPSDCWVRLDMTKPEYNGYEILTVSGPTLKQLNETLSLIPLAVRFTGQAERVADGNLLQARLLNGREILLSANIENKSVSVYSLDMQPIHVNLAFDPHWQAPVSTQKQEEKLAPQRAQPLKRKPGKGRHL